MKIAATLLGILLFSFPSTVSTEVVLAPLNKADLMYLEKDVSPYLSDKDTGTCLTSLTVSLIRNEDYRNVMLTDYCREGIVMGKCMSTTYHCKKDDILCKVDGLSLNNAFTKRDDCRALGYKVKCEEKGVLVKRKLYCKYAPRVLD